MRIPADIYCPIVATVLVITIVYFVIKQLGKEAATGFRKSNTVNHGYSINKED